MVVAVLLAAGAARRFGGPKMVAELAGRPLVTHAAERLLESSVHEIVVVVRPEHQSALRAALNGLAVRFAENADASLGMSASLAVGLRAVPTNTEAVVVALGDQPTISAEVVDRLIATWRATGKPIVVPIYSGVRAHPVLFASAVFEELLMVTGDQGGRDVIARDPARVVQVEVNSEPPVDVDVPEDLDRLAP